MVDEEVDLIKKKRRGEKKTRISESWQSEMPAGSLICKEI